MYIYYLVSYYIPMASFITIGLVYVIGLVCFIDNLLIYLIDIYYIQLMCAPLFIVYFIYI